MDIHQGWIVVSVKQIRTVDVTPRPRDPTPHIYLEALKADGSIVFHRWSPDSETPAN